MLDSEYTDKVVMKLLVPVQDVGAYRRQLQKERMEEPGIEKDQELYYAVSGRKSYNI